MEQRLLQIRSEIAEIRTQMMQLPTEREDRTAELRFRMADLEQRVTEVQRSKSYVLRAPVSGRVSGLQAHVGQVAAADVPLLSIVPQGAELEAQLLVPTRSAGFLGEGQEVRLMYDAFPYQRFGLHSGRVRTVAWVAMTPDQVKAPIRVEEPVYPVRVKIAVQAVNAYGRPSPCSPVCRSRPISCLKSRPSSIGSWAPSTASAAASEGCAARQKGRSFRPGPSFCFEAGDA